MNLVAHRPNGSNDTPSSGDTKAESGPSSSTPSSSIPSTIGQISPITGRPPMVLLHGLGGGAGLWSMNLDALSREYEVIAIDLLGFGRSTRQQYKGSTADDAIAYWINSLEQWRINIGIQHMILVGHSLGSYIALNYSLSYPSRVTRLVVVCPFGIVHSTSLSGEPRRDLPFYWKVGIKIITATSPQTFVRLMGRAGPSLMYRFRGNYDNGRYTRLYGAGDRRVSDYVYHLTAGSSGSGDYAFMALINEQRYVTRPLRYHPSLLKIVSICSFTNN
jgi:abhydrolase domain-containing protein 5